MSVVAAVFFGFLLYQASVVLKWFTIIRGFYFLLGVIDGLLIGKLEVRIVTRKLMKETDTLAWQILPISLALCGLPLLLATTFFEISEFLLPFAAYLVLPFVPVYYATSGWLFNKFERQNKVQVFMFIYGLKYWTEPVVSDIDRFHNFLRDVASKDSLSMLSQTGYSKRFMAKLDEMHDIEVSTRKTLLDVLQVMSEYRHRMLTVFATFLISCWLLIVYFFVLVSTNTFGLVEVVNHRIVSGQVISLILGCVPTFLVFGGVFMAIWRLRKRFRKRISIILASLDSNKLSSIIYD